MSLARICQISQEKMKNICVGWSTIQYSTSYFAPPQVNLKFERLSHSLTTPPLIVRTKHTAHPPLVTFVLESTSIMVVDKSLR